MLSAIIKRSFIFLFLFVLTQVMEGQEARPFSIELDGLALRSTHHNYFKGPDVRVMKGFSERIDLGLGIAPAFAPWHDDNGWRLTQLRFVPVYGAFRWKFVKWRQQAVYFDNEYGISCNRYWRQDEVHPTPYLVKEQGFFSSAALGYAYNFHHIAGVHLATGLRAYKISSNDLDVNPHGLFARLGVTYYLN